MYGVIVLKYKCWVNCEHLFLPFNRSRLQAVNTWWPSFTPDSVSGSQTKLWRLVWAQSVSNSSLMFHCMCATTKKQKETQLSSTVLTFIWNDSSISGKTGCAQLFLGLMSLAIWLDLTCCSYVLNTYTYALHCHNSSWYYDLFGAISGSWWDQKGFIMWGLENHNHNVLYACSYW